MKKSNIVNVSVAKEINYIPNDRYTSCSILISNECNLACSYCYQTEERVNRIMSPDMAEKAIDFLIEGVINRVAKSNNGVNTSGINTNCDCVRVCSGVNDTSKDILGIKSPNFNTPVNQNNIQNFHATNTGTTCGDPNCTNPAHKLGNGTNNPYQGQTINIMFFGGEPTMSVSTMKTILEYGYIRTSKLGIGLHFTLITNCAIWTDELEKFLTLWYTTLGNVNIQLSIDGCPEVLRYNRRPKPGSKMDSGKVIEEVAKKYVEWGKRNGVPSSQIHAHGCVSKFSLPYVKESYDWTRNVLGIDSIWYMAIHEDDWDDNDLKIFEEQYTQISDSIYDECIKTNSPLPFEQFSSYKCDTNKQDKPCGAGSGYLTFDTDGNLYPCHRFAYPREKAVILGHIDKGIDPDVAKEFENVLSAECHAQTDCKNCVNNSCKFCMALNYMINGDKRMGFPAYCKISLLENELRWRLRDRLVAAGLLPHLSSGSNNNFNQVNRTTANNSFVDADFFKDSINNLIDSLSKDIEELKSQLLDEFSVYKEETTSTLRQILEALSVILPYIQKYGIEENE